MHKHFSGALEEWSGKGHKASTHLSSLILVHLASNKVGLATIVDVEPAATLDAESEHP